MVHTPDRCCPSVRRKLVFGATALRLICGRSSESSLATADPTNRNAGSIAPPRDVAVGATMPLASPAASVLASHPGAHHAASVCAQRPKEKPWKNCLPGLLLGNKRTLDAVVRQRLHVVRALEGARLRHRPLAEAALHLLDGLVLVLFHPPGDALHQPVNLGDA